MKVAVIGGAGFIGSHLVDALVLRGDEVLAIDDLSVGKRAFLAGPLERGAARLVEMCVSHEPGDVDRLTELFRGVDCVFHLAANPDARTSLNDTFLDIRQNQLTTWAVLEAMRRAGVGKLVLSSSGTVYGDIPQMVGEDHGPILPISLYGASKVASEALVSAYAHCFAMKGWIFRFGNVTGPRATHGLAFDLLKKLDVRQDTLELLGDGNQRKPYLHVSDCVAGMLFGLKHAEAEVNYFNLAPSDTIAIRRIAELLLGEVGLLGTTKIVCTGGTRGWAGDVPTSMLDPAKLDRLGFRVRHTSEEAVCRAIQELCAERHAARG